MSYLGGKIAPNDRNNSKKRGLEGSRQFKTKKRKTQNSQVKAGSAEEALVADVRHLLEKTSLNGNSTEQAGGEKETPTLPESFTEIDLTISSISSTGDGLALSEGVVYVVPFTAPGDVVRAKVIRHVHQDHYCQTDFLRIVKPSPHRDDSLIKCPYFTSCSGCQFQMLPYSYQLAHKKTIVEKAYSNFSSLPAELVPDVGETIGSPLQYGYRTKLTPHFDGPRGGRRARRHGETPAFEEVPPIGFMKKGTRETLDIEECPIGTPAVQMGLRKERRRVAEDISKYTRGATLLLRESTERISYDDSDPCKLSPGVDDNQAIREGYTTHTDIKTCITDNNATSTEYVGPYIFKNPGGAFFQNNNSILPIFTEYIRARILPAAAAAEPDSKPITNLIDAYSGSGLFTITLSQLFKRSTGIDISSASIDFAKRNAALNNLVPSSNHNSPSTSDQAHCPPSDAQANSLQRDINFIAADAAALFASITFPPRETAVILDPPRKGCDEAFLQQLVDFEPERIVYVSCNVHTQARDVGWILRKAGRTSEEKGDATSAVDAGDATKKGGYEIESLRGFDFFPQTGHVEGVAVLRRTR